MIFGKYTKWESRDGNVYNIKDMSDEHIINCISMFARSFNPKNKDNDKELFNHEKTMQHGVRYVNAFCKELRKRSTERNKMLNKNNLWKG